MKYAVIYARYSSERQTEQSIEGQLTECNKFAEKNGLTILDTYIDRAMTGTNDNRMAFQQMLSDAEKEVLWDVVLVYAIDRFGRNSIEIAVNKQRLKKHGKILISATQRTSENLDGSKNLDGILLENVYIGLAEYYSAELSQKIRRGLHESRTKGWFCGGTLPYGYKKVPVDSKGNMKKIEIDENTAPIVQYIFQSYSNGMTAPEISTDLAEKGILYRGKPFIKNTIYNMLRLEKYIGIARYSDGVYTNLYPPIIEKDLFDRVQLIIEKNAIGGKSSQTNYLLHGKLICGKCGKPIAGEKSTSKSGRPFYYYKCSGRKKFHICDKAMVSKDKLEQLVCDILAQEFGNPKNKELIIDKIMEINVDRLSSQAIINTLEKEKATAEISLKNILKAVEQGFYTQSATDRARELEEQIKDFDEKIAIEKMREEKALTREQVEKFIAKSLKLESGLLIKTLIQKIIIDDEKMEILCNYTENNPINPDDTSPGDDCKIVEKTECKNWEHNCPPNKKQRFDTIVSGLFSLADRAFLPFRK